VSNHVNLSNKAAFLKHLPFESATSLSDAKYIASDRSETHRYKYRAAAVLSGNNLVKVGQIIYLDKLEQGMSGYWTVLSAKHVFGTGNAKYQLEVVLGTDVVGDTSEEFATPEIRDFAAEFSEQSLDVTPSILEDYSFGVNNGKIESAANYASSARTVAPDYAAPTPTVYEKDIYKNETPNFSKIKRTTKWAAK
jgi:hypothetical protein